MTTWLGELRRLLIINCLALLAVFFPIFRGLLASSEFYGDPKLGLQVIESDRYGASYYVQSNYTSEKDWPLIVVLYSDEAQKGKIAIETWLSEIKKQNAIVLFVSYLEPRESPFASDARLLRLIRYVENIYRIDDHRVLITGFGEAAHYAFYAAFRYPTYFSAVALVAGSMEGRLSPFLKYGDEAGKLLRYVVVYGDQDKIVREDGLTAAKKGFEVRGYQVDLQELHGLDHKLYPEFCSKAMGWFNGLQPITPVAGKTEAPSFAVSEFFSSLVRGIFKN